MEAHKSAIGIDIGGTHTTLGLVRQDGNIIWQEQLKTRDYRTPGEFIAALEVMLQPQIGTIGMDNISGIGIGAPNGNYYSGTIELAANLPWKGVIPVAQMVKDCFHLPVRLTNDANAGALGEMIFGAARSMKNFAFITLGTGLGSGLVANGQLIYGHDGFAGELGHTIISPEGRPCGCGRKGCLETYASATGLVTTAIEFLQQQKQFETFPEDWLAPVWHRNRRVSAHDVFVAAENQDPTAIAVFDYTAKILGLSLANLVALTSPEAIIFFGGMANAGDHLFTPTKKYMEDNLLPVFKGKVQILRSQLPHANAALLGAASLVLEPIKSIE
ncbi:MAG TPA: ROK family protein [Edaphocola sp.]|nr:ROK family protein [Edaphocola sp.]